MPCFLTGGMWSGNFLHSGYSPATVLWDPSRPCVGSNILKAALPYAKHNAKPSQSLCLWSRNSTEGLPSLGHTGFVPRSLSLGSRGSSHAIRADFLMLIPCLVNFSPLQDLCQHQSIQPALTCAHAHLPSSVPCARDLAPCAFSCALLKILSVC